MLRHAASLRVVLPVLAVAIGACGDDESPGGSSSGGASAGTESTTQASSTSSGPSTSSSPSSTGSGGDATTATGTGTGGGATTATGTGGDATTATGTSGAGSTTGPGSGGADASSSTGTGGSGGADPTSGSGGDGGGVPICQDYPVTLTFPDGLPAATADLQTFAPGATLGWAPSRGTLSSLSGLGVTLDCAGNGGDVWDAAWAVFEAHPDLFQLDRSEWGDSGPFPCTAVTGSNLVNTYRTSLAGVGVQKDVFAMFVAPGASEGEVVLNATSGFYLPVLSPDQIDECPSLSDAELEERGRDATFAYSTFEFCAPTGGGTYEPQPNDVFELGKTWWEWDDGSGAVVARKLQSATLYIDESNVTEELVDSDANCPDESGDERVYGFSLTIDPITGEIVNVRPGVGCIVC